MLLFRRVLFSQNDAYLNSNQKIALRVCGIFGGGLIVINCSYIDRYLMVERKDFIALHLFVLILLMQIATVSFGQDHIKIELWPGEVPGSSLPKEKDHISPNHENGVLRIDKVTDPMMEVYVPDSIDHNGQGIILCPGGGYYILAIDLEGSEVAEWLATMGYTVFVLHYRVPNQKEGALQDVQRAIRLVRANAADWGIDPMRLGVMGFSAGGSLAARVSTRYQEATYAHNDAVDKVSCKPDFAILIYPAYLDKGQNRTLTRELIVDTNTPSTFIFATADDKYANSALIYAQALRDAKVSVELHLLAIGGHGYGLRRGNPAAEAWPKLLSDWLSKR